MVEDGIQPVPDDLYAPKIEGADDEIRQMSYDRAKSIYGDELPEVVTARLEKELKVLLVMALLLSTSSLISS